jgi:hypothetical protein
MGGCSIFTIGSKAINNANLVVAWLEAIFLELVNSSNDLAAEKKQYLWN